MTDKPNPPPSIHLTINGHDHSLEVEPRVTLLDALRERLDLTGTKKGCDQGQCGACTVHVDGQRVLACLTLAAQAEGREITTIEGLAGEDGTLNAVQAAFLEQDAFQCGYCTPGQIMSAVACIREGHAGSDDEIREYMAGNLCRCGAYPHIVAAVRQAALEVDVMRDFSYVRADTLDAARAGGRPARRHAARRRHDAGRSRQMRRRRA